MKKIMFSDKFGLTQAVLDGRKTMTRRVITDKKLLYHININPDIVIVRVPDSSKLYKEDYNTYFGIKDKPTDSYYCDVIKSPYKVGEVVAIAQSYKSIAEHLAKKAYDVAEWMDDNHITKNMAGWLNKMFVRAGLMIFKIRITNARIERMQNISDDDCMREGVYPYYYGDIEEKKHYGIPPNGYSFDGTDCHYPTPREAFAALIDKVSGKGVWESNPWVFAYEFELIK